MHAPLNIMSHIRFWSLHAESPNILTSDNQLQYCINKQLLDEVEHDIMNYQNQGLCYLPTPKAEPDNTDTRF